jgi:hypothetical protein
MEVHGNLDKLSYYYKIMHVMQLRPSIFLSISLFFFLLDQEVQVTQITIFIISYCVLSSIANGVSKGPLYGEYLIFMNILTLY